MKDLSRFLHITYSLYGFALFIILMLLLFPFFLVASLLGKIKGGNMIYRACHIWADSWFFLTGIKHTNIFQSPHDFSKQYIFVSNHISYLDIPVMLMAVRKQQVRILGKAEMARIPLFGFIYKNAAVMVDRKDANKRTKSVRVLKSVLKKGISIFICPEGTFNLTGKPLKNFYDGAFRIAIEMQTPLKPILILDTYKRLNYKSIFSLSPGMSRAVYLEEVKTNGLAIHDINNLKNEVFKQMEEGLIRYKAGWIKHED